MLTSASCGAPITLVAIAGGPACDTERHVLRSVFCKQYPNCTLKQIGDTEDFAAWLARTYGGGSRPAAAVQQFFEPAPAAAEFTTAWDQSKHQSAQFPTALSARPAKTGPLADHVNVFGEAALPASGRHAWTVAFAGAAGGSLDDNGFAGVVERKEGTVGISKRRGSYGLRDDKDSDALRVDGKGRGRVRRNAHGRAFSQGNSITMLADMDARPRSLTLYRNQEPEPLGTVAGFGAEVYICAACNCCTPELAIVLSFDGLVRPDRSDSSSDDEPPAWASSVAHRLKLLDQSDNLMRRALQSDEERLAEELLRQALEEEQRRRQD
jgi:hypothetical protein